MASYLSTKNIFLKPENQMILDGEVIELTSERAEEILEEVPGSLVALEKESKITRRKKADK